MVMLPANDRVDTTTAYPIPIETLGVPGWNVPVVPLVDWIILQRRHPLFEVAPKFSVRGSLPASHPSKTAKSAIDVLLVKLFGGNRIRDEEENSEARRTIWG